MNKIKRIRLLLETERQKVKRLSREVTHDPQLSEAIAKEEAYGQCVKILEDKET